MACLKFYFAPLFLWEGRIIELFHNLLFTILLFYIIYYLPYVDTCAVASLLEVARSVNFGCNVSISFHVGMFIMFDSAPESIKKSISRSGG